MKDTVSSLSVHFFFLSLFLFVCTTPGFYIIFARVHARELYISKTASSERGSFSLGNRESKKAKLVRDVLIDLFKTALPPSGLAIIELLLWLVSNYNLLRRCYSFSRRIRQSSTPRKRVQSPSVIAHRSLDRGIHVQSSLHVDCSFTLTTNVFSLSMENRCPLLTLDPLNLKVPLRSFYTPEHLRMKYHLPGNPMIDRS